MSFIKDKKENDRFFQLIKDRGRTLNSAIKSLEWLQEEVYSYARTMEDLMVGAWTTEWKYNQAKHLREVWEGTDERGSLKNSILIVKEDVLESLKDISKIIDISKALKEYEEFFAKEIENNKDK